MKLNFQVILGWALGIFLLLMGMGYLAKGAFLSGTTSIAFGLPILPPIRAIMQNALKLELKIWHIAFVFLAGGILPTFFIPEHLKREFEAVAKKRDEEAKRQAEERTRSEQQEQERSRTREKQATQAQKMETKPKTNKTAASQTPANKANETSSTQPDDLDNNMEILTRLSLEERKDAFHRLRECEKNSLQQANAEFGNYSTSWSKAQVSQHSDRRSELLEACTQSILQKYRINREELGKVDLEGIKKSW